MVKYGGTFKDIMQYRYNKTEPSAKEIALFKAVSYLGEAFNSIPPLKPSFNNSVPNLNGKVIIRRNNYSDNDHLIVTFEGREVFHITVGISDAITLYIPGEWEDKILKRYYEFRG